MPRQTCKVCDERKSIDEFPKDSRNSSGYETRCRACKNSQSRRKVQCPNCNETCARADLVKHMQTRKCINGEDDWKHPMKKNKRFKSNGKEIVTCPCKHKKCSGEIKESTAYRHMKYGISRLENYPSRKATTQNDSERDL